MSLLSEQENRFHKDRNKVSLLPGGEYINEDDELRGHI
jgi:hypothetical protein